MTVANKNAPAAVNGRGAKNTEAGSFDPDHNPAVVDLHEVKP